MTAIVGAAVGGVVGVLLLALLFKRCDPPLIPPPPPRSPGDGVGFRPPPARAAAGCSGPPGQSMVVQMEEGMDPNRPKPKFQYIGRAAEARGSSRRGGGGAGGGGGALSPMAAFSALERERLPSPAKLSPLRQMNPVYDESEVAAVFNMGADDDGSDVSEYDNWETFAAQRAGEEEGGYGFGGEWQPGEALPAARGEAAAAVAGDEAWVDAGPAPAGPARPRVDSVTMYGFGEEEEEEEAPKARRDTTFYGFGSGQERRSMSVKRKASRKAAGVVAAAASADDAELVEALVDRLFTDAVEPASQFHALQELASTLERPGCVQECLDLSALTILRVIATESEDAAVRGLALDAVAALCASRDGAEEALQSQMAPAWAMALPDDALAASALRGMRAALRASPDVAGMLFTEGCIEVILGRPEAEGALEVLALAAAGTPAGSEDAAGLARVAAAALGGEGEVHARAIREGLQAAGF